MWHHLKFPKQPSFTQYLLLFPIAGLLDLKANIKTATIEEFATVWVFYIFLTALWCTVVVGGMYVICTNPMALLIPVAIMLSIAFLLLGLPRIIYKLVNRKPRK